MELKYPRLSAVLSGAPRQVLSLIPDAENGLFSRFIFYTIDVALVWNDVFAGSADKTMEEYFDELGKRFDYLYTKMQTAEPMTFPSRRRRKRSSTSSSAQSRWNMPSSTAWTS